MISMVEHKGNINTAAARSALTTGWGHPLRFVEANAAPPGEAYEHFIARTGGVPTRHNRHDHFNAAIWLRFPKAKACLNAMQANDIAKAGTAKRGALRDWATHWDEMGMIIACASEGLAHEIHGRLAAHDWLGLLWEPAMRSLWGSSIHAVPFGHALMERWLAPAVPHKGLTAKCWVLAAAMPQGLVAFDALDERLTGAISESLPRLLPLPVMGVPGACAANTEREYYEDEKVFRKKR